MGRRQVRGDGKGIFGDDPGWDADVFGVGAVVEEKVFAEVLLAVQAEEAGVTGGGVEGDDAVVTAEGGYAFTDVHDGAGEFMAEETVGCEHFGVVAAAKDFEVCAAGEGGVNAEDEFPGGGDGLCHAFQAQVFPAVQHRTEHGFGRIAPVAHGSILALAGCGRPLRRCVPAGI